MSDVVNTTTRKKSTRGGRLRSACTWILITLLPTSTMSGPVLAQQDSAGPRPTHPAPVTADPTAPAPGLPDGPNHDRTEDLEPRELTGFLDDKRDEYRAERRAERDPTLSEDGSPATRPPLADLPVLDQALADRVLNLAGDESLRVIVHLDYLPHAAVFDGVTNQYKNEIDSLEADRQALLARQAARRDTSAKIDAENYPDMFTMDEAERLELRSIAERHEVLSTQIKNQVTSHLRTLLDADQAPVVAAINSLGGTVEFTMIAGNTIVATVPAWALEALSKVPGVMRIVEDSVMEGHLTNADEATMVDPTDTSLIGLWDSGQDGGAFDAAIIDSGIDLSHPGMENSVSPLRDNFSSWYVVAGVGSASYAETCCSMDDFQGHGTHVSGIVGSYGTALYPGHLGMAHGVDKLVHLKAGWLNTSGTASMFWSDKYNVVDRALYHDEELAPGGTFLDDVDGMNLSYGGTTTLDDTDGGRFWDSVISTYSNLPVTISAGNSGPSNANFNDPAVSYNAIAVANYNDRGTSSRDDDIIRSSSTVGPTANGRRKPDIAAPGTSISAPNNDWEDLGQADYVDKTGTSMAAPMVLGVIMDLMDAGVADEVALKALLINTAQKNLAGMNIESDADGWDPQLGFGAMNAYAAYFHRFDYFIDSVTPGGTAGDFQLYKGSMRDEGATGEGRDRATMVWNRAATYNPDAAPTTFYSLVDLNMRLYRESNNSLIDFDTDFDDNVHQVRIGSGAPDTDVIINSYAWSTSFSHGGATESFALATEDGFVRVDHPSTFQGIAIWPTSVEPNEVFDIEFWLRNDSDIASHSNQFNLGLPAGFVLVSGTDTQNVGSAQAGGVTAHVNYTVRAPAVTGAGQNIVVAHSHNSYNEPYGNFNWNMGINVEVDLTPPNPNPMTFSTLPFNDSTTSLSMTASFASDLHGPADYFLQYWNSPSGGSGGTSSGWQSSRSWTDTGLGINDEYCYRAWARDNAATPNLTTPSSILCSYTTQLAPSGVSVGPVTTTSITAVSSSLPNNLTLDLSGLLIQNSTAGTDSGWKQDNNAWTSMGLTPATAYSFVAQARNGDGDPTSTSPSSTVYTLANIPAIDSLTAVSQSEINVELNPNGNSVQAEYFIENTTTGSNSGWINSTSWSSSGLACNTFHNFQARARNGDGVETIIVPLGLESTGACGSPCPTDLNLVGELLNGTLVFEASGTITTDNVSVEPGANVTFVAGQSVGLGDLTSVSAGATYTVFTDMGSLTCTP